MTDEELSVIRPLPKGGPLAPYRALASFDYRKIKLFFESADLIKYKVINLILQYYMSFGYLDHLQ